MLERGGAGLDGVVSDRCTLSLDDLRALPAVESAVTMECAGNGRVRIDPRPVSQPWLLEAVGTARWRGASLESVLDGRRPARRHGRPLHRSRPRRRRRRGAALRARAFGRGVVARRGLLAYEVNGVPLPPQHGFPLRLVTPGWYGMTNVKWLDSITAARQAFHRLPAEPCVSLPRRRGRRGHAGDAHAAARAHAPARSSGLS